MSSRKVASEDGKLIDAHRSVTSTESSEYSDEVWTFKHYSDGSRTIEASTKTDFGLRNSHIEDYYPNGSQRMYASTGYLEICNSDGTLIYKGWGGGHSQQALDGIDDYRTYDEQGRMLINEHGEVYRYDDDGSHYTKTLTTEEFTRVLQCCEGRVIGGFFQGRNSNVKVELPLTREFEEQYGVPQWCCVRH